MENKWKSGTEEGVPLCAVCLSLWFDEQKEGSAVFDEEQGVCIIENERECSYFV
ncbi:hypothetical protein [Massilicoli timonensis]|uniref:hypothetical protein n=1 Tax=Massilicoli timonensis TaxID=2015901 RepID=UPI0015E0AD08|nr:hypothetical protein [Massilicoli timonensis]